MPDATRIVVLIFFPVRHRPPRPLDLESLMEVRRLADELRPDGIRLVPLPPWPSPWYPPFLPVDLGDFEEWLARGGPDWREFEYWWHSWMREWPEPPERWWRYYREHFPETLRIVQRLIERRQVSGALLLTSSWLPEEVMQPELEQISELIPSRALLHLEIGRPQREEHALLPGVRSFRYPENRDELRAALRSLEYVRAEAAPAARPMEAAPPPPAQAPEQEEPDNVHLGAAAPSVLSAGQEFVARFAAYTLGNRENVQEAIQTEAPFAETRLGLSTCLWRRGARVNVRLSSSHIEVSNPNQEFRWNGAWHILRFDAKIAREVQSGTVVLHFDVAAEGLPLVSLRPEIRVRPSPPGPDVSQQFVNRAAPRSAFASYARGDRRDVLGRVRSLQIFTGIDVFLDCLSIRPGEQWKPKLKQEISAREIFWLFWSREARKSEWVEWEWRTALREKSIEGIQPHPLEPADVAPPPHELSSLQFGAMYEWYVRHLREPRLITALRLLWRAIGGFLSGSRRQ